MELLGVSLPTRAVFFIYYILVHTFSNYPSKLLRIGPYVITTLKTMKFKSEAEKRNIQRAKGFLWERNYPVDLLIFLIAMTYAPISPFILPWALIYFCFVFMYAKYSMVFVNFPQWDSGGLYWPAAFNRVISGMIIAQLVMIAFFVIKQSPAGALVVPLPIITVLFSVYCHRHFDKIEPQTRGANGVSGINFSDTYEDFIWDDSPLHEQHIQDSYLYPRPGDKEEIVEKQPPNQHAVIPQL